MSTRAELRRITQTRPPFSGRLTLTSTEQVSDSFLRVTLHGEDLALYDDPRPADAFRLLMPPAGERDFDPPVIGDNGMPSWEHAERAPVSRAFTVRHLDCGRLRLTFDVAIHPGHTLRWLRDASPGDPVGVRGMRAEYALGEGIDHHVLIGDASAMPAIAAIVESLAPGAPATAIVAVDTESDHRLIHEQRGTTVTWVAGGSPTGDDNPLIDAVRSTRRPEGHLQAWLCGETDTTRALRRHLLGDWGVARDDLHVAAYWKAGIDASTADADLTQRFYQAVARGADPTSPDTRELVEFGAA